MARNTDVRADAAAPPITASAITTFRSLGPSMATMAIATSSSNALASLTARSAIIFRLRLTFALARPSMNRL